MAETKIRVPLKKVIEGIEMATDEWSQYLDIEIMEIESLPDGCRMNLSAPLTAEAHSAVSNPHFATMAWSSSGMIFFTKPTAKSPSGGAMTTDLSTMRRMTNEACIT